MYFPEGEPWLHFADSLPFPVEVSLRMKLIPPAKASKDVSHRLAARQGHGHSHPGGRRGGADRAGRADRGGAAARARHHQGAAAVRLRLASAAGHRADQGHVRPPGRGGDRALPGHRASTSSTPPATSSRCCASRCQATGSGSTSYVQRQPLYTIAGGMPTATVGPRRPGRRRRWIGPYIGETLGRARSVVHFDPLVAAARNRPTAIAITGEPGGGKTTLALLLIHQLALRGVTVAVIDPKGDAESLVRLLQKRGRQARVLPLGTRRARPARPVLVRRRPGRPSGRWPPRRSGCCCRG